VPRSCLLFDMQVPPDHRDPPLELYTEMLDMARHADRAGIDAVIVGEHHSTATGYNPTSFVQAAALAAATTRIRILATSVLALQDPVRVAEDIAVVDLLSRGRLEVVFALGYAPAEFALFGVPIGERVRRLESGLRIVTAALRGEPFDVDGRAGTVTPRPAQRPHPPFLLSGGVDATARRAARLGLGLAPMVAGGGRRTTEVTRLVRLYEDECRGHGREPGPLFPVTDPVNIVVSEDPERTWRVLEPHVRVTLGTYITMATQSATAGAGSGTEYPAITPDLIRNSGSHVVVTPPECIQLATDFAAIGQPLMLQPLVGGLDPKHGWQSLELFTGRVLPTLRAASTPVDR
jgi:alkanesulfonate monooxygenase SsuD/methylene tetrahydromethanopterin reductase-like flavin-dependent oxidoreductase (luciferase family)